MSIAGLLHKILNHNCGCYRPFSTTAVHLLSLHEHELLHEFHVSGGQVPQVGGRVPCAGEPTQADTAVASHIDLA